MITEARCETLIDCQDLLNTTIPRIDFLSALRELQPNVGADSISARNGCKQGRNGFCGAEIDSAPTGITTECRGGFHIRPKQEKHHGNICCELP